MLLVTLPPFSKWSEVYYALGAALFVISLIGMLRKPILRLRFIQIYRDKLALADERDRATKAAETAREYAHIVSESTREYKALTDALTLRIDENDRQVIRLQAEVLTLSSKIASLYSRLRLALRHIIELNHHNRIAVELLATHAPNVTMPPEPIVPPELDEDLKALGGQ